MGLIEIIMEILGPLPHLFMIRIIEFWHNVKNSSLMILNTFSKTDWI